MKKKGSSILGMAIGGISLYIFLGYFFDWDNAWQIIRQARIFPIILAAFGFILTYCLRALKWTYILRCRERISWQDGYHATMVSSLANFALPVRFGEVLRLFIANKTANISYAVSTAASLVDFFALTFFVFLFVLLTPLAGLDLPDWVSGFNVAFFIFLIVSVLIFVLGIKTSRLVRGGLQRFLSLFGIDQTQADNILDGKIISFFENILTQCHFSAFTKFDIFIVALISIMTVCTDGFYFYLLVSAFGLSLSYFKAILAACFMNVFFFIPSPPVRVGTAEMYLVLVFSGVFHLPSEVIATAAILWHVLTTLIISVLGVYSMIALGLQLKTVLNISSEPQ